MTSPAPPSSSFSPPDDGDHTPAPRGGGRRVLRFFLAQTPDQGSPVLVEEDGRHARKVLRLQKGDTLEGLDGVGAAWPLRVTACDRRSISVEAVGPARREPAPGEPGAPLPWIEIAAGTPKGNRAETMIAGLVALGAALITPLRTRYGGPGAAPDRENRRRRLERTARETCKQCGRLWVPTLAQSEPVAEWIAQQPERTLLVLDPEAETSLLDWTAAAGPEQLAKGIRVALGAEGGFAPDEFQALLDAGATPVRLGPHVLRIEVAAQAAMGVLGSRYHPSRSRSEQ